MNNPNDFIVNGDFASIGNDSSVQVSLTVPNHSVPASSESTHTAYVNAPSRWLGKQIRAVISISGLTGDNSVYPGSSCLAITPAYLPSIPTDYISYSFIEVGRVSDGRVRLLVRCVNSSFPPVAMDVTSFTITARVRTVIGN